MPILPILTYLLTDFVTTFYLIQLLDLAIIVVFVGFVYSSKHIYTEIARNLLLFLSVTIFLGFLTLITPFFESEIFDFIELVTRIGVSISVVFVLVNLEYNFISAHKHDLKDKYSHDISQNLQILKGKLFLLLRTNNTAPKTIKTLEECENELNEIENLIKRIRSI